MCTLRRVRLAADEPQDVCLRAPARARGPGGIRLDGRRQCARLCDAGSPTTVGQHVRVTVSHNRGRPWCLRKFSGSIVRVTSVLCLPTKPCPQILIAPQTIARFSFRVTRSTSSTGGGTGGSGGTGGQTSGPTFAGLTSATECIPGLAKQLPVQRTVTLTWSAATDPTTPSSQIVYDIFYSPTSGGENYSSPSKTSAPGAASGSFVVAGTSAAYFVVRARDTAGREDQNTVERIAVNTCTNA